MFKNSAASAFASKKIASSKWLLLVCAASAAVVDIIIIAMLFAGGEGGEYLACPFILLIFDVFYFIVSLFFTNFRFKYSLGVWISYIILYTVGFSIGNAIILGGSGTVLTNGAIALWESVHGFNILCAIICALFASHIIKKLWIALAFAVLFLAGVATYAGYMFTDGFFGQGRGSRTLVYSYDKSAEAYSVTDVLAGKSKTVTVPETFNGKPVTKMNLKVFADSGIKTYNLPENVAFTGEIALNSSIDLSGKRINVDKKSVNDIREKFLDYAVQGYSNVRENALALANATLPVNLAENEGYVAFNYDITGLDSARGKTIPVYVGDLKSFDLAAYTAGYDYVEHREDGSAENYYWASSRGVYILSDLGVSDSVSSSTVAMLKFEKVYCIKVDDGNDTKYLMREKQPELCYDNVGGGSVYKYLTMPKAKTFLNGLIPRKGFTNRWLYYYTTPTNDGRYFTDLCDVLEKSAGQIPTISTRWELNRPVVSINTSAPDNTITFGDNVTFSAQVEHEAEGITVNYAWNYEDELQPEWRTKDVTLTRPAPAYSAGKYKLTVTVGGDEITSLGAVAETSVDLSINRRRIEFNWRLPENAEYDGTSKSVSVSYDESQQVEGYPVSYNFSGASWVKDAGTYSFSVHTDVITAENYEFVNTSNSFTITPCPAEVSWTDYTGLVYNGYQQGPKAAATGVSADGELTVVVTGRAENVGEHTAKASTTDGNYRLTNASLNYTISKAPLTVKPEAVQFTYGDSGPTTVDIDEGGCVGFVGGEGKNALSGTARASYKYTDRGEYPDGVSITGLSSGNYEITYQPSKLTILPRPVHLLWHGNTNLVYNAQPKNVYATVTNAVNGDEFEVGVSNGNGEDAGSYTAQATSFVGAAATNYTLTAADNVTCTYTIAKAPVRITADNKKTKYGEALAELSATVSGTIYNDDIKYECVMTGTGAGAHEITVSVTRGANDTNYSLTTVNGVYTVEKRLVYVKWNSVTEFIYDGNVHEVFRELADYSVGGDGFVNDDMAHLSVTGASATNAGYYTARAQFDSAEVAKNYTLAAETCEWKIRRASMYMQLFATYGDDKTQITSGESAISVYKNTSLRWEYFNGQGNPADARVKVRVTHAESEQIYYVSGNLHVLSLVGTYTLKFICDDDNYEYSERTYTFEVTEEPVEIEPQPQEN